MYIPYIRTAAADYLVYATYRGIYAGHVHPSATSQPFPVAMFTRGINTFDVNYENETMIAVSSGRLKEVAFDNINSDESTINVTGSFGSGYSVMGRRGTPFHHLHYMAESVPPPQIVICLLYTSPSPRDRQKSRMPSSA